MKSNENMQTDLQKTDRQTEQKEQIDKQNKTKRQREKQNSI